MLPTHSFSNLFTYHLFNPFVSNPNENLPFWIETAVGLLEAGKYSTDVVQV